MSILNRKYKDIKEEIDLELIVKVYNINYKEHSKLLESSKTLNEYSYFVESIREYMASGCGRDKAIYNAIKKCLQEHVLETFLKENGSEVVNMLFTEYNIEREMEVVRKESREEGREEGIRESIIDLLSELGNVEDVVKERLQRERDLQTLKKWTKLAARCESIEEFLKKTSH